MRTRLAELQQEVRDFATGSVGHIRIGTGAVTAESILAPVLKDFLAKTPGATLEIVIGMGDVLRQALRQGQIDVIVSSVSWDKDEEFMVHVLCDDEVAVVANRNHEVFRGRVALADLTRYKWILPGEGVANRQWLNRVFTARALPAPEVQIVTSSVQLLPRLIAETNLLSFVSRRGLSSSGAHPLRFLPLRETTLKRHLGFIFRSDSYLAPAALKLIEVLKSTDQNVAARAEGLRSNSL
jgi:DNA-binding transcriptional LysR family regulator